MKRKILIAAFIAVVVGFSAYNFHLSQQEVTDFSQLTFENLDAIATSRGGFPACQQAVGTNDYGYIPFCVNGECQENVYLQAKVQWLAIM